MLSNLNTCTQKSISAERHPEEYLYPLPQAMIPGTCSTLNIKLNIGLWKMYVYIYSIHIHF